MGLILDVYRSAQRDRQGVDCSNNGISRRFEELCVVNVDGPFHPRDGLPPVLLRRSNGGRLAVHLVPAMLDKHGDWVPAPNWFMHGGNFAGTSDSRFSQAIRRILGEPDLYFSVVSIHDRVE
jgi:hypothetical protein